MSQWVGGVGLQWVGVRDAAKHPIVLRTPPAEDHPPPKMSTVPRLSPGTERGRGGFELCSEGTTGALMMNQTWRLKKQEIRRIYPK